MPIEYAQLVRKLKRKEQSVIAPSRLKREIRKVDIRFTNKEPQGAHELLAGLLDLIKEESVAQRSTGSYVSTVKCMSCSFESSTKVPTLAMFITAAAIEAGGDNA